MKCSRVLGLVSLLNTVLAAPAAVRRYSSATEQRSAELDITQFLTAIASLFPVNAAIADVCDVLADGEGVLANTFGISSTVNSDGCADVTLLFARGTCETGNVGVLVGPPLIDALSSALGSTSLSVQGVNYDASVANYLDDSPSDGQAMSSLISSTISSCPNTQIVLSGYSQGGYVVFDGAADAGAEAMSHVSAVVIFGDPDSSKPVPNIDQSKVLVICHAGDNICQGGDIVLPQHLTYAENVGQAASFIASQV